MVLVDVLLVGFGEWLFGGINWVDINDEIIDYFIFVVVYLINIDEFELFNSLVSNMFVVENEIVVMLVLVINLGVIGLIGVILIVDEKYDIDVFSILVVKNGN